MNAESAAELSREELITLVGALRAHIAELERRLGLNSSNSGKPPSSDGLRKPARVSSLRERSGKKPGGQKGHKGETLRQVTDPNEVVNHHPPACSMCGVGASTGRTRDRTRPMLQKRQKVPARAPSTRDPISRHPGERHPATYP
jgi:transposase